MKQPLMVMPPAQAEILYDAALEDEQHGIRQKVAQRSPLIEEWDDREFADGRETRLPLRHTTTKRQAR